MAKLIQAIETSIPRGRGISGDPQLQARIDPPAAPPDVDEIELDQPETLDP